MIVIQNIDNIILQLIQLHMRNPIMDKVMPWITNLGSGLTIWMFIGLALAISKKYRMYGIMVVCSLILCYVVGNLTLKPLVARTRPFDVLPLMGQLLVKAPKDFSFPSGHAMSSFAASGILLYMNKKVGIAALALSVLIAFSRLYLYVHYPSDVFAGIIIGTSLSIITIIVAKVILRNKKLYKNKSL